MFKFNHPLLLAIVTGFISGFLLSVPVGPVNVTIVNEGARRGLLWALLIGVGATVMEVIYCALAFTGFASFFTSVAMKTTMEIVSFVFMFYLAVRFWTARTIPTVKPCDDKNGRTHPHSAFAIGFMRVLWNPGVFLGWVVLAAYFKARDWVGDSAGDVCSCVAGVGVGVGAWFTGLSYGVSRGTGKFSGKTLLKMEHGSGIVMFLLALAEGAHLVVQMVRHHMQTAHHS